MLTRSMRIKLIAFLVTSVIAMSVLGSKYMGIDMFGSSYNVTVSLPDASGAFDNGEVTYRGVPVGRITSLKAEQGGATVVLKIDGSAPDIPADVAVKVSNRSAIGEQYIDLSSDTVGGPRLKDGDTLSATAESLTPAVSEVLTRSRDFVGSVNEQSLKTVIDESYEAAQGVGKSLGTLIDTSKEFIDAADKNFLVTSQLIDNSQTVLTTQQGSADSIRNFSEDLNTIASTLSTSDGDLRRLIQNAPAAAQSLDNLINDVGRPLGMLMTNLVSTAQVFGTNADGVEDALITAPEAFSVGWAVSTSRGINLGLVQNYFDPLPCTTGYERTKKRGGLDTAKGERLNLKAGCRSKDSRSTVRGPKGAPAAAAVVNVPNSMQDLMGGSQ